MLSLKHEAASDRSLPGLQQSVLGDRRLMKFGPFLQKFEIAFGR